MLEHSKTIYFSSMVTTTESFPVWALSTLASTQQKLREFGWEVLMHPPYSPDLAPSDFHLFRSLQNSLGNVRFTSREDCQNHLSQFFDQKPQNFYSNGITSLSTRWQKVIQQNGTYIL
ncbi:hypothetical protein K1T71_000306 [Dendrolimus kikuchii]|uniref:Uncharacterized protein n=1 Tax=Dendrolimus kikuchii TaxID=765133 RepID=A0ACC1DJP3_9NEOP|nr:hypothetical protein K1T71_000306 [Dendrolimus kikuchii]